MYKLILIFIVLMTCGAVSSECYVEPASEAVEKSAHPYTGANVKALHVDYKKGYGHNLLNHNFPQVGIYSGIRLSDNLLVEAGYEHSIKTQKSRKLYSGEVSAGVPVNPILSPTYFVSRIVIKGPYIDFIHLSPLSGNRDLNLLMSSGVSFLQASAQRHAVCVGQHGLTGMPRPRYFKGDAFALRFSMGVQYMVTGHLGFRASAGWINASRLNLCSSDGVCALYYPEIRLRDAVNYSFGLFWSY